LGEGEKAKGQKTGMGRHMHRATIARLGDVLDLGTGEGHDVVITAEVARYLRRVS
jgi:hypothetical protein